MQNFCYFSSILLLIRSFFQMLKYIVLSASTIYTASFPPHHPAKCHSFLPPTGSHFARYFGEFQALPLCVLHCSHFSDNTKPFFHMHCDAPDHTLPPHDKTPTASPSDSFHLPSLKTDDTSPRPYTDRSPAPSFFAKHSYSMPA